MSEWFDETLHDAYHQGFKVREVLFESKTEHQHLIIFESGSFGRVMALDGIIQTTERDEFIYHEMLAHTPLFAHGNAKNVLIIGGGDGGLLREVLKHPEVESVVQVEIDQAVIDMCVKYLPQHSDGAYNNSRAEIVIGDGIDFVTQCDRKFDVILSDSTDPIGPGEVLFTSPFYQGIQRCLSSGGIFAAQNGVAFMQPDEVSTTHKRLSPLFTDTAFYAAAVPTYVGGIMTFAWASDNSGLREQDLTTLQNRFVTSGIKTRYYNPALHLGAFALPQYLIDSLT
ncbi:Polyamine aminopropyltransferase [Zhongshania aliphaticivorans]|uniref:Polyamine aminopropyltransferase n=1 Tax=Zhongshania aliphaticivorans TaxID=1470434 RepID=A0A5S9N874_9GAMM|nr:polyamine aminopropyltransferase [Zhongshania aliphaticivorans]CAA0079339.1 Polyamine aminopropyltransferase [Zhongshania aliphaticivorans]CAA0086201.1 Polyamine aminopropyltransferase [Zhongshania aliphaticivorans]